MIARTLLVALLLAPTQEPDPRLLRLLDVLERRHREAVDPGDARAAAARLGFDRARILAFVRDAIAWEPYEGVLRDASGTLRAGSGNSLDRALLLQAMLEAGGERTRLVRGDLDEAGGRALRAAARPPGETPAADLKSLAADLGVEAAALESVVESRRREREALVAETLEAAGPEADRLGALLGAKGAGRPAAPPTRHYLLQAEEKGGWTDLDPSPVPLSPTGIVPVEAAELAALRRRLSIRLVLVRRRGEARETQPLLSTTFDVPSLLWKPLSLVVGPDPAERLSAESLRPLDARERIARLRAVKVWRAGLVADGRRYGAAPFDLAGTVYEVDRGGAVGAAKGVGKSVGGALGGFAGALGGEKADKGPATALERLVLEVGLREPDGTERIQRRDLLEPPSGGIVRLPLLQYAFLLDGAPLPPGEAERRERAALAALAPALRALARGEKAVGPPPAADVPSLLLRFADLRRRLAARAANGRPWGQDRPGLAAETFQLVVDERSGTGRLRRSIDLFENPARTDAAAARLAGVADTILEAALLARRRPGEGSRSAWPLLERARLAGAEATVDEKDGRLRVRWSDEAWWEVDPATGGCVGRVASGAGQGMVEYAWEQASNACNYADLASVAATGPVGQAAKDAAELYGDLCGIAGGTWARDRANNQIKELTQNLWSASIDALSGP